MYITGYINKQTCNGGYVQDVTLGLLQVGKSMLGECDIGHEVQVKRPPEVFLLQTPDSA